MPVFSRPAIKVLILVVLAAGQLLLGGCAASQPGFQPDRRKGVILFRAGEELFQAREYTRAAVKLEEALRHLPDNIDLILRSAEVLERIDQPEKAAEIYRSGLDLKDRRRNEIVYHLARLELYVFGHPERALELQKELKPWDWRLIDLKAGRQLLVEHKTRDALRLFLGLARRLNQSSDSAFAWYHAALAFDRLNDADGRTKALLNAVDRSRHKGLDRRIESLWEKIHPTGEKAA